MARSRNRDQVLKTLRKHLDEDRTKTYVVEVSPLGLVEMTRQNVTDGVREILTTRCPTCDGEGVVRSEETVAIEVLRELRKVIEGKPKPEAHLIRVNPRVAAELLRDDSGLTELEAETGKHFHFEGGATLPIDTFDVAESGTRRKIEERALPFQVGEEVLVTIEEPHMYNADDAIARVDSYIVSVSGGRFACRPAQAGADRERGALCGARLADQRRRRERWRVGGCRGIGGRRRRGSKILDSTAPRPQRRQAPFPRRKPVRRVREGRVMSPSYAIVETGGKQYRAEKGATLLVDRISEDEGAKVSLRPVMFRADKQVVLERGELDKVKVEAKVAEHLRGDKIRVFKYKPKKGYRRRAGHRSELTKLEVTEVKMLTRRPAAKKQTADSRQQTAEKKPAAKKAAAKKPAAKKAPAKKRQPAKKKPASEPAFC